MVRGVRSCLGWTRGLRLSTYRPSLLLAPVASDAGGTVDSGSDLYASIASNFRVDASVDSSTRRHHPRQDVQDGTASGGRRRPG